MRNEAQTVPSIEPHGQQALTRLVDRLFSLMEFIGAYPPQALDPFQWQDFWLTEDAHTPLRSDYSPN